MTPQDLLIQLRSLNIRVRPADDVIRCKTPEGATIPADLADQIRALKPGLLDLLREEQVEIDWRAESGLLLEPPAVRPVGACAFCGVAMPYQQTGKCVLCCLAAAQVYELRGSTGQPTYPRSPIVVNPPDEQSHRWDMSEKSEAA